MFDKISEITTELYSSTFGDMNGKEILWTVIGLLALYQLVMIKWRLINHARQEHIRNAFMRGALNPLRASFTNTRPERRERMIDITDYVEFERRQPDRTNMMQPK